MSDSTIEKAPETISSTPRAETLGDTLFSLGTAWARYGITIGKLALETSAKTLENTSKVLGHLAETLEDKKTAS